MCCSFPSSAPRRVARRRKRKARWARGGKRLRGEPARVRRDRAPGGSTVNLSLWIAARYLRTRRQSGFISLLTGFSVGGVALNMTALFTVLAVMNGFENEIQSRIAGTDAHGVLLGETASGIERPEELVPRAAPVRGVVGAAASTYVRSSVVRECI